ncbi:hypothetical protein [Paenibacillus tyrfis]|uniref:Uncharacterized protein n=1 Tax=Paenibacillus tyrfis TaxID=1501230 RepID=A0A081NY92_9BACL|nr:hypothetical protein [Paenibacillus tyrfis]KEQ23415.1 hypothetical protein ET33_16415 [Paenibacillus tyrfis]
MAMPQQKLEQSHQVEISPEYDKLFDGDLTTANGTMYRRQMTVADCDRLFEYGAISTIGKE